MKSYQKILFPIIVAMQVFVLIFMIARQEHLLATGAKVMLKCEPIDPRSLFSGDYVILNYEISTIEPEIIEKSKLMYKLLKDNDNIEGRDIYVALRLKAAGRHYYAAAVSDNIDELKQDYEHIIRGKVSYSFRGMRVRYGVETYFVPQGEGKEIEKNLSNVSVEVSISDKGDSAVSKLFIDNNEVVFY